MVILFLAARRRGVLIFSRKARGGNTLFHVAVGRGNVDEIKYLVFQGLDINARGEFGETPLYLAATKGDVLIFELIIQLGGDCSVPDYSGVLPGDVLKRRCAE